MENSNSLEDFYYQLLHIRKDERSQIEDIVFQNRKKFLHVTDDFEGLCKICSNHVAFDLDKSGIDYQMIHLKERFGFFDHTCILARYKDPNSMFEYLLVDISFIQFLPVKGRKVNPFLKEYPASILAKTEEGKKVADALVTYGMSLVSSSTFSLYVNSFRGDKEKVYVDLKDLFSIKYK